MKQCAKCRHTKTIDSFYRDRRRKGGYSPHCKACNNQYRKKNQHKNQYSFQTKRIEDNRFLLSQYLQNHPCVDCREGDIVVLEFDHVRGNKRFGISYMVSHGYRWETILEEIAKCDVVCSNCHKRRTAHQQNWSKLDPKLSEAEGTWVG